MPKVPTHQSESIASSETSSLQAGVRDAFVWVSPERAYKPKDFNWILNSILVLLLIVAVLLFLREFVLIAVVLAITFLIYVLGTVPPRDVEHKITTEGLVIGDHSYIWDELAEFWFEEKYDQKLLIVETNLRFPPRLVVLLADQDPEDIKHFLVSYIPYREKPIKNWVDNLSKNLERKLSL